MFEYWSFTVKWREFDEEVNKAAAEGWKLFALADSGPNVTIVVMERPLKPDFDGSVPLS